VKLNPELIKKYEEVFKSFEKEEDSGYVQTKDIPAIMKILGAAINEQEIIEILGDRVNKDENPLISSKIDFTDFLTLFVVMLVCRLKKKMKLL
jgi:Ca2+-binding EF-hand superfamily protein